MSDNFLQQIQTTETQAQKLVHDAEQKGIKDLEAHKKKLEKDREMKNENAKNEAKKEMVAKQAQYKKKYTDDMAQETKEIEAQKRQLKSKEEKALSAAQLYFLNELI
jgi:hypothetical protein